MSAAMFACLLGTAAFAQTANTYGTPSPATNIGDPAASPEAGADSAAGDGTSVGNDMAIRPAIGTGTAATSSALASTKEIDSGDSILDEDIRRLNTREPQLDERLPSRAARPDISTEDTPGIRIGNFVLRPTVTQSVNTETTKDGNGRQSRAFLQTDMKTTLTSDWSLHQLLITTEGSWQKNVGGEGEEQPNFQIDGDLRLDLADRTTAHITGGYRYYREDTDDPNAVEGASKQSDVQEVTAGLSIEHQLGRIRGTVGLDLDRTVYSDAQLDDGTTVSLSDRNETTGTLRGRLGYELSPAIIPFVEASVGKSVYNDKTDSAGYKRSGNSYALKGGAEIDLGEKLRGEASLGYATAIFDDARLADIDAVTVDASLTWSPLRGTDVNFAAQSRIQPSTTAGEGGYVSRGLSTTVSHRILENLTGTVIGGIVFRDYPSGSSDQTVYSASTGLIWNVNRYLDFTSTLGYEITDTKSGSDSQQWRAGIGLRLKR